MTICAIYARVSDESQLKGDSIDHQISYCKENARRRSHEEGTQWFTPDTFIYVDEGITGTSMVKRPAVQRLIRDARARQFEVVLFKGISRFARDTVDALLMLRTLTACGVRVVSMEENFDSRRDNAEFIFTIHSALAQAESEKTAIRVRVGAAQKARSGKWNGQPPDGYTLNPETKRLEVDESFAPIVSDIFTMYLNGYGCRKIADVLNGEGRYTKRGNFWTQRNISRMLRNPVYVGDVVYGRREQRVTFPDESDPLARKKRAVWVGDPERHTVCNDAHPGIVSRELFEQVQEKLDKRRLMVGSNKHDCLLSKGLLICTCGSSMTITYNKAGTPYYRCLRKHDSGRTICNSGHVRARDVEQAVLNRARTDILEAINFDELVIPEMETENLEKKLVSLQKDLSKEMDRSQQLFDQYTVGNLLDDQYTTMNSTIRNRILTLQKTRDRLLKEIGAKQEQANVEQLVRQAMHDFLNLDTSDVLVTREILSMFIKNVTVLRSREGLKEISITYRFAKPVHETKQ
ncbi:recombinase family protein [Alicyclobacillus dauci]|uniref:Recombinase family protein n=1 Tax=Alicyclobacillus dauci TaxID=1475485 RepID=A0ABY6Z5I4_9BACL|nr:recombinase family protein [Alicyclobacillus dauci]WAH38142.1 recombinase family protein [Alicyclobacillus dauci]